MRIYRNLPINADIPPGIDHCEENKNEDWTLRIFQSPPIYKSNSNPYLKGITTRQSFSYMSINSSIVSPEYMSKSITEKQNTTQT